MNVSLPKPKEQFVRQKVTVGDYETASEVVLESLKLKQRDENWKSDIAGKLARGLDSIRAGRTIPADQVKAGMTFFKKSWPKRRGI